MSKQTTKRGQPSPSSGEVRRVDPWVPESLAPAGLFPVTPEVSRHVILMLPPHHGCRGLLGGHGGGAAPHAPLHLIPGILPHFFLVSSFSGLGWG